MLPGVAKQIKRFMASEADLKKMHCEDIKLALHQGTEAQRP